MAKQTVTDADAFALLVADLYEAAGVLRRLGERTAATEGQTQARWQVLSVVSNGDWTVPLAAERLGTSRQAVQRIANELVADGLAVFGRNPGHRRSPFLHLTADGRTTLEAISGRARKLNGAVVAELDLEGVDVLSMRTAIQRLIAAVRTQSQAAEATFD